MHTSAVLLVVGSLAVATTVGAKLPDPTPEQRDAAALAAAKTAYANAVGNYDLCLAMDRVAARYIAEQKAAGRTVTPLITSACVKPAVFVPPAPTPHNAGVPGTPSAAAALRTGPAK